MREGNPETIFGAFARLLHCIRVLGWRYGWRYWRVQNYAMRDPGFASRLATRCDEEAEKLQQDDPFGAAAFHCWAKRLRETYPMTGAESEPEAVAPERKEI